MFPKNFTWGVATSAYQIEGAYDINKLPSIWDTFANEKGNILNNETGNIACDSYHLYQDDIQLMKKMNVQAYRFSISWTRIFEEDMTTINQEGLQYYLDLVDNLIENGIEPYITLFHWDLPQILQDQGGWLNRNTLVAFERYAKVIAESFNNKVFNYFTINEPQIVVFLGYSLGLHAPGYKLSDEECLKISHNILVAHGLAVKAIRENSDQKVKIGIASTGNLTSPIEDNPENREAAYQASFKTEGNLFFNHALFLDPIFLHRYPSDLAKNLKDVVKTFDPKDFEIIGQEIDILGINIYNGQQVDAEGNYVERYQGFPKTAIRWPVTPEIMNYGLSYIYRRYQKPIVISENGLSCNDRIYSDNRVHDLDRVDFIYSYLKNMKKAMDKGVDIIAYFHWSFTDNFEWHNGYNERFGLVYIDYRNQQRIMKDSAYYYANIIKANQVIELENILKIETSK